jgi:hypothetical protein
MKITALLCATLILASCDNDNNLVVRSTNPFAAPVFVGGSPTVVLQPLAPITACPFVPSFTPTVSLVVTPGSTSSVLDFDTVTFRLISGSSIGGPTVTFPKAGLTELFGTTSIVGTRTFVFTPSFGCPLSVPTAVVVDATLIDQATSVKKVISASANLP